MARYADVDKQLEKINNTISNIAFNSPYQNDIHTMIEGMERVRDCVEESPTADVVEVVRCRNCKYQIHGFCSHNSGCNFTESDSYCSYGERKVDNDL